MPFSRSTLTAFSTSPPVSSSAFLQSMTPAPERSRSCFTASAVTATSGILSQGGHAVRPYSSLRSSGARGRRFFGVAGGRGARIVGRRGEGAAGGDRGHVEALSVVGLGGVALEVATL